MRIWLTLFLFVFAAACGDQPSVSSPDNDVAPQLAPVNGVALDMAERRAAVLSDINYALSFEIPAAVSDDILLREVLTFNLSRADQDLQLDFRETADKLKTLEINGAAFPIDFANEHLVLPAAALAVGANTITIELIAGGTSLNRNPDYLYTLFVPDRARTAFPVFDQPNLKATYDLVLDVPVTWRAMGNGITLNVEDIEATDGERASRQYRFARSDKLSSYLFSFVAGEFQEITRTVDGRQMTMFHRETDADKVARNIDVIFSAHADALSWLEEYTGIDYPFQKFDFALIPTFQYNGMEHVGAIQYRASSLFLDEDPSDPQRLNRANLIAHETAHMWFGDLVTMDWFNDVWTKEVFANFIAAKIVNPSFPDIDHDLNFLLRSYPAAYAVDRTTGANPIRQALPNLNEAGNLYGGIIYNKAPIMMRQLELLLGEDLFRDGLREYLATFANANATWPDLIDILDARSDQDLKAWSEVWVNTAGRPHFRLSDDGRELVQEDPSGKSRIWPQRLTLSGMGDYSVEYSGTSAASVPDAGISLYNSSGEGYGLFPADLKAIASQWADLTDLQKGAQLINLYEQFLEGSPEFSATDYIAFLMAGLDQENELLLGAMLGQLRSAMRLSLGADEQLAMAEVVEPVLRGFVFDTAIPSSTRKIYLRMLQDIARLDDTLVLLETIWSGEVALDGISLSSRERSNLAALLAIKRPAAASTLLDQHLASITNPDERRRFEFIKPALSPLQAERDAFFASLADVENRAVESWVLAALGYLHHPERVATTTSYIAGGLELMEEIQATGDIFFPGRWMAQILQNHTSSEAADQVRNFLSERPGYNAQLRLKILQAADMVFRAERIGAQAGGG